MVGYKRYYRFSVLSCVFFAFGWNWYVYFARFVDLEFCSLFEYFFSVEGVIRKKPEFPPAFLGFSFVLLRGFVDSIDCVNDGVYLRFYWAS